MVYISDKHKFIFIENPKSASSCVLNGITSSLGVKISRGSPATAHLTCQQIKEMYPDKWETYIKVSTYREPQERYNSALHYHYFNKKYNTMALLGKHLRSNDNCIFCKPQELFTDGTDFLINVNNIQADFDQFCKMVGMETVKLVAFNQSPKKIEMPQQFFNN